MGPEINSEELVPWCERRGIDASEIIAREPERWRASDGIHYLLRRYRPSSASKNDRLLGEWIEMPKGRQLNHQFFSDGPETDQ